MADKQFLDTDGIIVLYSKIKELLKSKVNVVDGKTLSSNDYTAEDKAKLMNIEAGAQKNVVSDWNAVSGDALIANKPTIPTKTSELTNDSNFVSDANYKHNHHHIQPCHQKYFSLPDRNNHNQ
jgi:putative intracellular protease/amidase